MRFQGKIIKSYRVLSQVIVCRVGAIVCIVRVTVCRVKLHLYFRNVITIKGLLSSAEYHSRTSEVLYLFIKLLLVGSVPSGTYPSQKWHLRND